MDGLSIPFADYWLWWSLAGCLLILEVFSGDMYFLWLAIGAVVMGVLTIIAPGLAWEQQLLIYAVLSLVSVAAWRSWLVAHPPQSEDPLLNQRVEQFVGRTCTLREPIVNGEGRVKFGDTFWTIRGRDCPPGTRVRIVNTEGIILRVEPILTNSGVFPNGD